MLETPAFVVHGIAAPSPLPGWMVVTSRRHVCALEELPEDALHALGPLLARVMSVQKSALGAEHVYLLALGDVLPHLHLHLIPRDASTPASLRGRAAFDASPSQMLAAVALEAAAARLRSALG